MIRSAAVERSREPASATSSGPPQARAGLQPRPYGISLADSGPGLTIGLADDPAEREADTMADQALAGLMPLRPYRGGRAIRRMCAECEEEETKTIRRKVAGGRDGHGGAVAPAAVSRLLAQPGRALDPAARSFFEARFERSFANVGVHDGPSADEAARSINARAFTAGSSIAFAKGEYAPSTQEGRRLLAHELAHVVQDSPAVRRAPTKPDGKPGDPMPLLPTSGTIADVMAVYAKLGKTDIKQYFIVDGNKLSVYDKTGKFRTSFDLVRPGYVDARGYYLGSPFDDVGWIWLIKTADGKIQVQGLSREGERIREEDSVRGELLRLMDVELNVSAWVAKDFERFEKENERGLTAMAVLNTPLKKLKGGGGKEGPVLNHQLPDWFKSLKAAIEKVIAADRAANKDDSRLPDRIFFYGSDKVQAQKGPDAWTIEVEKGTREAYLTIAKTSWEQASDKDAFAKETAGHLYNKVKLILDDIRLKKEEQKEITEIDSTGEKKKGSKWGWAVQLKKRIEALLAAQKASDSKSTDFPDKLTLTTQVEGGEDLAHLRVWVYDNKDPAPGATPQLQGGTIPGALGPADKAEDWVPIVRKAAEALRKGAVTTVPGAGGDEGKAGGDPALFAPYDSLIHPVDMSPDLVTATIAENIFRMVVDVDSTHGGSLLNRTTIHMGLSIGYSWRIYPLPADLKKLKRALREKGDPPDQVVAKTNELVRENRTSLGVPVKSYDADYDWDQQVEMSGLGEGDYFVAGTAAIAYPSDWNIRRQSSLAALPFTVMDANELAKGSAFADSDAIAKLKAEQAAEKDEKKKELLAQRILELQWRESHSLEAITAKDLGDTEKLLETAYTLQRFVESDRKQYEKYNAQAFMDRLRDFDEKQDQHLFGVYYLVRQTFDRRYDDKYAVDEYIKLIIEQKKSLEGLTARTGTMTKNEKWRADEPHYRGVAALVKKEDGTLVPLLLLIGHHEDSNPPGTDASGKEVPAAKPKKPGPISYKMMLLDVTFESKKQDMTYVGDESADESTAVRNAFEEFGHHNKYGDGEIAYRLPEKGFGGKVTSSPHWTEYLAKALAVISIVLLIAGTILSAGTLAPASAAAIGMIVTGLGIAAGVAGAILAGRNIYKRVEKGTFELDAEFALDVVSIIGAFVQVLGTAGRIVNASRAVGVIEKTMTLKRLDKIILIYDAAELGANVILVSAKVHSDLKDIDELNIPEEQKEELRQQVAMDALMQGAMLAHATFSKAGEIHEAIRTRVENSNYSTMKERGWIGEDGHPTESAPAKLREHALEPGKAAPKAAQGEAAWKETEVLGLGQAKTHDDEHQLTVTEKGRIIRCSDYCTDLRLKYAEVLKQDPSLEEHMAKLEGQAKAAATSKNKAAAKKAADEAADFEAELKQADALHKQFFGASEKEIDAHLSGMTDEDAPGTVTPGKVTGGKKSGRRIDGRKMPRRMRRLLDVLDIMRPSELAELGKGGWKKAMERVKNVMGRKVGDIDELKGHWAEAREHVLKGKKPKDYSKKQMIDLYDKARDRFWDNVRKDPKAVAFLKANGFELPGKSGAAMAELGPRGVQKTKRGNITNQERRISLDHSFEKALGENYLLALEGNNLELMFQNANSYREIVQMRHGR